MNARDYDRDLEQIAREQVQQALDSLKNAVLDTALHGDTQIKSLNVSVSQNGDLRLSVTSRRTIYFRNRDNEV